ncbi:MAG TPA: hypothetical protein VHA56_10825 [Mucilaginibacter sp.]|nr:hypothetical protein [Mucilaginibacter sp.]
MKRFLFLFLAFGLPVISTAQSHFRPGFVVSINGDTTRGLIDLRGWDQNPDAIKFKKDKNSPVQQFTVDDINYFSIDKIKSYIKYTGRISLDNINENHVLDFRDTTFKVASVFLRILQKGKYLALYSYSDAIKTRFYIGEQPDYKPTELVYRLYYDMDAVTETHGRTVNEDTYMKQLYSLALKYNALTPSLQSDIEQAGYRQYYINQIVKAINSAH